MKEKVKRPEGPTARSRNTLDTLEVVTPIEDQQQMKPGRTSTGPLDLELEEEKENAFFRKNTGNSQ